MYIITRGYYERLIRHNKQIIYVDDLDCHDQIMKALMIDAGESGFSDEVTINYVVELNKIDALYSEPWGMQDRVELDIQKIKPISEVYL